MINNNEEKDGNKNYVSDNTINNNQQNHCNGNMMMRSWNILKTKKNVQRVCCHVIPYMHSLVNHVSKYKSNTFKLTGLNEWHKISFVVTSSAKILGLTVMLKNTLH